MLRTIHIVDSLNRKKGQKGAARCVQTKPRDYEVAYRYKKTLAFPKTPVTKLTQETEA